MVAWQPNWNDVDYDELGAYDAIERAAACRRVLEDRDAALAAPLAAAREQWHGAKRVRFDADDEAIARRTHVLIDALAMAERRIRIEIDEARMEQARRVAERERYVAELRAEQEAERLRAEEAARLAREAAARAVPVGTTTTTTVAPPVVVAVRAV